jgi:cobalt-zinc-cadmium efflux system outer membrane protein
MFANPRCVGILAALAVAMGVLSPWLRRARAEEPSKPDAETRAIDYRDEATLIARLWNKNADVLEARSAATAAAADLLRSRTYPNPTLDAGWNTIPVGNTTPPGLSDPLTNVPNYTFGLSELIEIAKRGPREAAAVHAYERAWEGAQAKLTDKTFDLLRAIGHIAQAQVRAKTTEDLIGAANDLLGLSRARASKGDVALVDVDRMEVEAVRLSASRAAAESALNSAQNDCAQLVAEPCPTFPSPEAARHFLEEGASAPLPGTWTDEMESRRHDVRSLGAAIDAADERELLGHRKAVPDVTVRVGYTYDTFVVSGNQRNSLGLGVQIPLPVLDHGQADILEAHSEKSQLAAERRALLRSAQLEFDSAVRERDIVRARTKQLDAALGTARSVRQTMEKTVGGGGASMADVLIARRSYQEILLDRDDLDGDAYEAALRVRQAGALLPTPAEVQEPAQ